MSRGLGRIQAAIENAFKQNPSTTYAVDELALIAYPGLTRVEKKHRVAVIRAADAVARDLGWQGMRAERPGHPVIYGNPLNLRSYATWTMRRDFLSGALTAEQIAAALDDPQAWRAQWSYVQPGSAWWQHVEINKARAAGDGAGADAMMAELNAPVNHT